MSSKMIRGTALDGKVRFFIANTTELVEEARMIHSASPVAIAALGRSLTATSMMGAMLKEDKHRITVKINGGGPIGTILTTGDSRGNVRGYVGNPQVLTEVKEKGKINVGDAVGGDGEITVIKDLGLKQPYSGTYSLVNGEIGEDFAAYFMHSEQQPSAVGLGVLINKDLTIKSSGGFIIQLLPNAEESVAFILEERIKEVGSVSSLFAKHQKLEEVLKELLEPLAPIILDEYSINYHCDCHRERFEKAMISLGKEELTNILEEDGKAELQCFFCNSKYYFSEKDLKDLVQEL